MDCSTLLSVLMFDSKLYLKTSVFLNTQSVLTVTFCVLLRQTLISELTDSSFSIVCFHILVRVLQLQSHARALFNFQCPVPASAGLPSSSLNLADTASFKESSATAYTSYHAVFCLSSTLQHLFCRQYFPTQTLLLLMFFSNRLYQRLLHINTVTMPLSICFLKQISRFTSNKNKQKYGTNNVI